jgi:hypothetical protein
MKENHPRVLICLGGIAGGVNDGPWNEQLPISGPGALQGAINRGLVIQNFTDGHITFSDVIDFLAGAGDSLTFGITRTYLINPWRRDSSN